MLIAQISDCHVSAPGALTYGHVDNAASLSRVVAHVNAGSRLPDIAVISGDITHDASEPEARLAKEILDKLKCPYLIIPGNHDDREVLRKVFDPVHFPGSDDEYLGFAFDLAGLRLIGLDSVDTGLHGGAFCGSRAKWLLANLPQTGMLPTLVFLHHPPAPLGVPETDEDGFKGAGELGEILAGNRNVVRICAGHIHLATQSMWSGILMTTSPSVGMELARDLAESGTPSQFIKAAPGYMLHHMTNDGNLISHVVYLPDNAMTYPFSEMG